MLGTKEVPIESWALKVCQKRGRGVAKEAREVRL